MTRIELYESVRSRYHDLQLAVRVAEAAFGATWATGDHRREVTHPEVERALLEVRRSRGAEATIPVWDFAGIPVHLDIETPTFVTLGPGARFETRTLPDGRVEVTPVPVTIGGGMMNEVALPVPQIPVRTQEQETRWRDLEARSSLEVFPIDGPDYRDYDGPLRHMLPCPNYVPPPPKIRVRVQRRDSSYGGHTWTIEVKVGAVIKELPALGVIRLLLPPDQKVFIPNRRSRYLNISRMLIQALDAGLSATALHDALRAWAMAAQNAVTDVTSETPTGPIDSETANLLRAQPATLEVGGKVYKLIPCHEVDVRPLITRVRTRALASAKVEGDAIKVKARTDARILVQEAEGRAGEMRAEVERLRAEAGNQIPRWVRDAHRIHWWNGNSWVIRLNVQCLITEIRLTVNTWSRILYWNPLRPQPNDYYGYNLMPIWLRLGVEGAYTLNNVYCDESSTTTHLTSGACMELQGLPRKIDSEANARNLEGAISRGLKVVNLNSPLSRSVESYWPDFRAQLPPVVRQYLEGAISIGRTTNPDTPEAYRRQNPTITWDRTETIEEEAEGVFTVQPGTMPPVPTPAAG